MDVLTKIGLLELALGAVLGWAVAATMMTPALVERAGVRRPRRVLQAHLDYVIMGSSSSRSGSRCRECPSG